METKDDKRLTTIEQLVGGVTAAAGAVTALLGMLGAGPTGALVDRLVRNEACLSTTGFTSVIVSIGLVTIALVMSGWLVSWPARSRWRICLFTALLLFPPGIGLAVAHFWSMPCTFSLLIGVGVVLVILGIPIALALISIGGALDLGRSMLTMGTFHFVTGLLVLTLPVLLISLTSERAQISAKLKVEKSRVLEATIKAVSVGAHDRVEVRVDRLRDAPRGSWEHVGTKDQLYYSTVGPNTNGEVSLSLQIPLPAEDISAVGIKAVVWKRIERKETKVPACDVDTAGCTIIRIP